MLLLVTTRKRGNLIFIYQLKLLHYFLPRTVGAKLHVRVSPIINLRYFVCVTRMYVRIPSEEQEKGRKRERKRIRWRKQKVKYAAVMQLFSQYLAKGKDKCLVPFPPPFLSLCTPQAGIFPAYILKETCFFDLVVHASVNIGTRRAQKKRRTREQIVYDSYTIGRPLPPYR